MRVCTASNSAIREALGVPIRGISPATTSALTALIRFRRYVRT
jgi:hypothetical protein